MSDTGSPLEGPFIPFARPVAGPADFEAVAEVIRSGWWTTGRHVHDFEESFARYCRVPHAVGLNSCTAALHLALIAFGVGSGDLVLTTTYTFAATAEVCEITGATPVLLDVDPVTLNIDASQVKALLDALSGDEPARAVSQAVHCGALPLGITRALPADADVTRVKAIVPVHFAGQACDMNEIMAAAQPFGIRVIEDAAHATEATYRGRKVGSIGDATAFSFYATKNLSTGEGGMVTTADEEVADRIRRLSLHGISRDAWKRYTATGSWLYEIAEPGYKYNLTDIAAVLGIGQLTRIDEMRRRRLEIVRLYDEGLGDVEGLDLPEHVQQGDHAWHLYVVRVRDSRVSRAEFIERLREAGIGTSVHFIPLHMHPFYRDRYGYVDGDYPVAERAFAEVVSLPIYPAMTDTQVERVVSAVEVALAGGAADA